jgi:hypothetical protein
MQKVLFLRDNLFLRSQSVDLKSDFIAGFQEAVFSPESGVARS